MTDYRTPEQRAADHAYRAGYNAGCVNGMATTLFLLTVLVLGLWLIVEIAR